MKITVLLEFFISGILNFSTAARHTEITGQPILADSIRSQSQQTCELTDRCLRLKLLLGDIVALPGDARYEEQQQSYWASNQIDLQPYCRVVPTSTTEVAAAIMAFKQENISFAVQSGGHSAITGASNIGDGVTLDLSSLSSITLSRDKSVLEVGAGARWHEIYEFVEQENLSVNGARAGSVGVGGFLLGGGISVSPSKYGWACDSVLSIEFITGNGSIVEANRTNHSGLFIALKGSGNLLGVATKFRLQTYSLKQLEVAFIAYEWETLKPVIRSLAEFNAEAGLDKDASADLSVSFDTLTNQKILVLMLSRTGAIHSSPLLHRFFNIPNLHHSVQKATHAQLALEIDMNNPAGFRQHKSTFTISNSASLAADIIYLFARLTAEPKYAKDAAYRPGLLVQPLTLSHLHKSKESGNPNLLGLEQSPDPLIRKSLPLLIRYG
jgi:hypothetical protein